MNGAPYPLRERQGDACTTSYPISREEVILMKMNDVVRRNRVKQLVALGHGAMDMPEELVVRLPRVDAYPSDGLFKYNKLNVKQVNQ